MDNDNSKPFGINKKEYEKSNKKNKALKNYKNYEKNDTDFVGKIEKVDADKLYDQVPGRTLIENSVFVEKEFKKKPVARENTKGNSKIKK